MSSAMSYRLREEMPPTMKRAAFILLCLAPFFARAATNTAPSLQTRQTNSAVWVGGALDHFAWKEIDGGHELLSEDGWLVGVCGGAQGPLAPGWRVEGQGKLYTGLVDYDGSIQSLWRSQDYKSKTTYVGFDGELLAKYPLPTRPVAVAPFAGLGLSAWQRELDTKNYGDVGKYGYTEHWASWMLLAGIEAKAGPWSGRIVLRQPFYNTESVKIDGDQVDLEPDCVTGLGVEAGYAWRRWSARFGYTADTFGQSDLDGAFYQPKSEKQVISLQALYRF